MELSENIVECLGEGVVAVNSSLKIIAFNQSAEVITGLPRSQTLNQPLREVFKGNSWLIGFTEKAIKEGFTLSDFERTLTNKELKDISVGITVSPLISMEGKTIGGVVVIKDLSAHNPLKNNLLRSDRLAFIGTFAAGIAHEIKNPLGGMRGAMQILSGKLKDENMIEYTDLVIREVDRIDRLLKKILSFSSPGGVAFRPLNL
ncbi:MAG: nitrogen regulation protein NR(II), partial [Thermodesulfobacteriota bacterium]